MTEKILVTGGAGFIGSHIVDGLLRKGYDVSVLDNLNPQVHGPNAGVPSYLDKNAEFFLGDVRDYDALKKILARVDVVFHEAAAVGVGQSMYQIREYVETNSMGAANILHFIANEKHHIRKMIVASSMSIYGEGAYQCPQCGQIFPRLRTIAQLKKREWEMICESCGKTAKAIPTSETKPLYPTSIYAITKRDHEEMFLSTGFAFQIPAIALRYFNVYGTRQALSNPYTGVCAIFASRLLNDHSPMIYEDGLQARDFTHVSDIVQANLLALEAGREADYEAFNVGTGVGIPIKTVGERLRSLLGKDDLSFEFPDKFRSGDIRHCYADISKIGDILGYSPKIRFEDGVKELVEWVKMQTAEDKVRTAAKELEEKGLIL
ncbi:SDR family NAD(P)-dependent oxidoreductase [Candidatus Sumerlaeota bacterium]|nr:SDR family NAD(P)-dependent oxidoreductase [Candidatus Sumerlaeota bacterium]